ncbi:MAG: hypothetical protein ACREO8_06435 [Luteimonas sp.]
MKTANARPALVTIAALILWLCLLASFVTTLLEIAKSGSLLLSSAIAYSIPFALAGLLVLAIWYGKNWARLLNAILMVLGLFITVPVVIHDISSNPSSAVLTALLAAAQLGATLVLFLPQARPWFQNTLENQAG